LIQWSIILAGVGACTEREEPGSMPTMTGPSIVSGEETGPRLRNVGMMAYRNPGDPTWYYFQCSGSLIARRTFLTASHCLTGDANPDLYGFADFGVAFPGRLVDTGDPFLPAVPDGVPVYSGHIVLYPGAEEHQPGDFPTEQEWFEFPDLALVVLDRPVRGIEPAELPPVGYLDRHFTQLRRGITGIAGYGLTNLEGLFGEGGPSMLDWDRRRFGTTTLESLTPNFAFLTPNPSSACVLDSGGPVFPTEARVDGHRRPPAEVDLQVGMIRWVEFFAENAEGVFTCLGRTGFSRLDTRQVHDFLAPYLDHGSGHRR
jgi:hypothetical protein